MEIDIAKIKVGKRKRDLDQAKVTEIAESIKDLGLLNPITLAKNGDYYGLVAGYHRLEAYKSLFAKDKSPKWKKIPANVVVLEELKQELAEIDENLKRANLTQLEEALFAARREEIDRLLHPEKYPKPKEEKKPFLSGNHCHLEKLPTSGKLGHRGKGQKDSKPRKSYPHKSRNPSTAETAKKTNKSKRTVRQQKQIAKALAPYKERLEHTLIADNQKELLKLTRLGEEQREKVITKLADGAKRVSDATKAIEREEGATIGATIPKTTDTYRLIHSPIETLEIEPNSIDQIITDPPYGAEYLPLYETLVQRAAVWLKPGGSLIVMTGQSYLPAIIATLSRYLTYQWILAYLTPGGQAAQLWERNINTFWKPVLWFVKGEYKGAWLGDVVKSETNDNQKGQHDWQQSESGMCDLMGRVSKMGDLILDPFCGSGTTGVVAVRLKRKFIGSDQDAENIQLSASRLGTINE